MVYVLAVAAAFLFAAGSVVQQRSASTAPPEKTLSFALLVWLAHQKLWLTGVGLSLVGNLLAAAALGMGGVALVQPLLTVRLLFALGLSAAWSRIRPPGRDWGGAVAAMIGLGVFVAVGRPEKGEPLGVGTLDWLIALAAIAAVVLGLTLAGRRLDVARQATLLAAGAGVLFGLQSSLTEAAITAYSRDGVAGMLTRWEPYAVAATAILGAVLIQSAYGMAPLTASYPALVTVEPLAGIAIGVGVLSGTIQLGPVALAAGLAGLALMTVGVYLLATSPLVNGQLDLLEERQEEGEAYRLTEQLEHDLTALENRLARLSRHVAQPAQERPAQERPDVDRLLASAEQRMRRLAELREDMRRHRAAEEERMGQLTAAQQAELRRVEQDLDLREKVIDERAGRLAQHLAELRKQLDVP